MQHVRNEIPQGKTKTKETQKPLGNANRHNCLLNNDNFTHITIQRHSI